MARGEDGASGFAIKLKEKDANNKDLKKDISKILGEGILPHYGDHRIDLSDTPSDDMLALSAVFEKHSLKPLAKDVRTLLEIRENPKKSGETKPGNLQMFCSLLTAYILDTPNRHVYEKSDGSYLTYLVTNVAFIQKRDRDGRDYVKMTTAYVFLGNVQEQTWTWFYEDCRGLSVREILANQGLCIETPLLRADYDYFCDLYDEYEPQIGRQFLASGRAHTDGIDGNSKDDEYGRSPKYSLDHNGVKSRVVRDVTKETAKETYTYRKRNHTVQDLRIRENDREEDLTPQEVPLHQYLVCFDLAKHLRIYVHVDHLEPYVYDKSMAAKLILPDEQRQIIDILTSTRGEGFKDVIGNKSGGKIIIAQGPPGLGKTLTAEIVAESKERPLYTIQCSQLGIDPVSLEDELIKCLTRGARWDAIILLDEADVYVQDRGESLEKNAIVGVFLRVLEYHTSTLFLTTNRLDAIDEAILSRALALIQYTIPEQTERLGIWKMLLAENGIEIPEKEVEDLAEMCLSGRDIKNLLKLTLVMGKLPSVEVVTYLLKFRPATTTYKAQQ